MHNPFEVKKGNALQQTTYPQEVPVDPRHSLVQKSKLGELFGCEALAPGEFEGITTKGNLGVFKYVEGVKLLVRDLGSIKNRIERSIYCASLMTISELKEMTKEQDLPAVDLATSHVALSAAVGDKTAVVELLDRTLGKPKQQIENKNVNLTIDDILTMESLTNDRDDNTGEN